MRISSFGARRDIVGLPPQEKIPAWTHIAAFAPDVIEQPPAPGVAMYVTAGNTGAEASAMKTLGECFEANRAWSARMRERDPHFFERLVGAQTPQLLWIGCSDSRLPPDQVVGRLPGEIFVHRNVGNVVVHTDLNCLSVLQYGIEVLKVKHVIVCGHYGCGGVGAAMSPQPLGLIDNWLRHIRDVFTMNQGELDAIADQAARQNRLCELNVAAQVANVCHTTIVQDAWRRGQQLTIHGWIYALADGLLRDLGLTIERPEQIPQAYRMTST